MALAACVAAQPPPSQDQQPNSNSGKPIKIDPTYQKLADETGGQVYVLDRNDTAQLGAVMALNSYSNKQELLTVNGSLAAQRAFEVPVGSGNRHLLVSATGVTSVRVVAPNGVVIHGGAAGVKYVTLQNGAMYAVDEPEAGTWNIELGGDGNYSLRVAAIPDRASNNSSSSGAAIRTEAARMDDTDLLSFKFQEIAGRPGHEGLFRIAGFPLAGQKYPVEAEMSGDFSTARFEFRSPQGEVLQSLVLRRRPAEGEGDKDGAKTYEGEVAAPAEPFRVYASGFDMTGHRYQRVLPQIIRPQLFTVEGPRYAEWAAGESVAVRFVVRNAGTADRFNATIVDAKNYLTSAKQVSFEVAENASHELNVALNLPAGATSDTLIVTVARADDANATNHAIVEASIVAKP